jgi:hypothetical protein
VKLCQTHSPWTNVSDLWDGMSGIVSAITFSPDIASGMFAVGTFKGNRISCYSEDTGDERVMELDLGQEGQNVDGHGITQVRLISILVSLSSLTPFPLIISWHSIP